MSPLIVGSGSSGSEGRSDRFGLPTGTSDPGTAEAGDLFYNTDTNNIRVYDGSAWADLASGGGGGSSGLVGASSYTIGNSITLRTANESYFSRTPSSGGNRRTWTWSGWVKRTRLNLELPLWHTPGTSDDSRYFRIYFRTDNTLAITSFNSSGGTAIGLVTEQVFRDITAWMHIVVAMDATQTTAADRLRIYVNGSEITTFSLSNYPTQNTDYGINEVNRIHYIGLRTDGTSYGDGYLANIHFIDGSALAPTAFGEFLSDTGAWSPIGYTGTYPGNSFHLDFALSGAIGNDASGAGNHFTPNQVAMDISQISGGGVVYSSGVTYSPSVSEPAIGAFDGSLATRTATQLTSDGYIDVSFSPGISYSSSVRFYAYAANGYDITNYYSLNGGSETTFVGGSSGFNGSAWITAATGSGIMSSFRLRLTRGNGNQSAPSLHAIEVDGVILTDKNFSGFTTDTPVLTTASTGGDAGGSVVGNYATLNPLNVNGGSLSDGNLVQTSSSTSNTTATIAIPSSGKWYWEITVIGSASGGVIGIGDGVYTTTTLGSCSKIYGWAPTGDTYANTTATAYTSSYAVGDVIGVKFNADTRELEFLKNGSSQGVAYTVDSGYTYFPQLHLNGMNVVCNFGQRPFSFQAPVGYVSLNTSNLPVPAVTKPEDYFSATRYSGAGTSTYSLGISYEPEVVWLKCFTTAWIHGLYTKFNGTGAGGGYKYLRIDDNVAEDDQWGTITFNNGGFNGVSSGYDGAFAHDFGATGQQFVAYTFNCGVSQSLLTTGSLQSNVYSYQPGGMSLVTYDHGSGVGASTIAHGLARAPEMIISKYIDGGTNYDVYHYAGGATGRFKINTADAYSTESDPWNNTAPTTSVFSVGPSSWKGVGTHVALCFHSVEGFSKVSTYTGNGDTSGSGPFVWCGFRPSFLMVKSLNQGTSFYILDDAINKDGNPMDYGLLADAVNIEGAINPAGQKADFLSNGFRINPSGASGLNVSGQVYTFIAFASSPFNYARAF